MNAIDLLNLVFFVLVGFSIYRFARAQQQKRNNEQQPTDERKAL